MALRFKVLSKKVEKFERKGMQNYKVNAEKVPWLDTMLDEVFVVSRPKPSDYEARRDLVRIFNDIAKEVFGKADEVPVVVEFGSFVMDLFSPRSDLDLSFNFTSSKAQVTRERKIQTLRKLARKFYALQSCGHVYGVHPVTTAKVPVLKVVDRGTGVECDLSVENQDGVLKSKLIYMICSIDERFRKLSFLMKVWAKTHKINSSKDGTLNSLSIILLVAFHLQTRNPPILPPFHDLFKDGTDPASVVKVLGNFANFGRGNKESVAELFVSLLIKLSSVERLWPKGLCASVYEGSWKSKTFDSKVATISVEDFTDRSQNVARAVGPAESKAIYKCIQQSIQHIFAYMDGQIEGYRLRELLFGQAAKPLVGAGIANLKRTAVTPVMDNTIAVATPIARQVNMAVGREDVPVSHKRDHARPSSLPLTKKLRYTNVSGEDWGGTSSANWLTPNGNWGGTSSANSLTPTGDWGGTSAANWLGSQQLPHFDLGKAQWGMERVNNWGATTPATEGWGGK
ncbi:OLC1v1036100C1 [Oldenlandia corymbosa var. corymbosa]|uniref:OLC1v1036100C1 n=1 Tax=Oldenlandia corymbosa var. corymbosa TaxID=529605 RepID=A0AAV1CV62_OLDCO|nr:OLC1v1036100C1 [Oldenlandia corymbosa var. corymbosa]